MKMSKIYFLSLSLFLLFFSINILSTCPCRQSQRISDIPDIKKEKVKITKIKLKKAKKEKIEAKLAEHKKEEIKTEAIASKKEEAKAVELKKFAKEEISAKEEIRAIVEPKKEEVKVEITEPKKIEPIAPIEPVAPVIETKIDATVKPAVLEQKEEKCLIVSLLGKPGAGKGTLADRVKDLKMGFKILSVGDLCREEIAKKSEKGKKLEAFVKEGKLAPDDMVHEMVQAWLEDNMKDKKLIILDGYPRTEKQAELFLNLLKNSKFSGCQFRVLNLSISDEKIIERLENRFICSKCKRTYNYPCPACGGKLIRRPDDSREIVSDRLKIYAAAVEPLMNFYKNSKTQIDEIKSGGTPDTLIENFKKVVVIN